jgi:hypothetical protein
MLEGVVDSPAEVRDIAELVADALVLEGDPSKGKRRNQPAFEEVTS